MQDKIESDQTLRQAPQASEGFAVGRRLQSIRKSRGLSQRELARRADMTNGSLSLIEQDKVSPSLVSLEKIVRAIPMTLLEFFYEQATLDAPVARKDECRLLVGKGYQVRINTFSRADKSITYVLEQSVDAGASCSVDWYEGDAHVSGIASEGVVDLELAGLRYTLSVGDRFHFGVKQRHRFVNTGPEPARAMMVLTPFGS